MRVTHSKASWLGMSLTLGLLLMGSIAALGGPTPSVSRTAATRTRAATTTPTPSSEPLAVFSRPRSEEDDLPQALAARVAESLPGAPSVPEEVHNGPVYLDQSRRLLAGMGSAGVSLYVFPSERGASAPSSIDGEEGAWASLPSRPNAPSRSISSIPTGAAAGCRRSWQASFPTTWWASRCWSGARLTRQWWRETPTSSSS